MALTWLCSLVGDVIVRMRPTEPNSIHLIILLNVDQSTSRSSTCYRLCSLRVAVCCSFLHLSIAKRNGHQSSTCYQFQKVLLGCYMEFFYVFPPFQVELDQKSKLPCHLLTKGLGCKNLRKEPVYTSRLDLR